MCHTKVQGAVDAGNVRSIAGHGSASLLNAVGL